MILTQFLWLSINFIRFSASWIHFDQLNDIREFGGWWRLGKRNGTRFRWHVHGGESSILHSDCWVLSSVRSSGMCIKLAGTERHVILRSRTKLWMRFKQLQPLALQFCRKRNNFLLPVLLTRLKKYDVIALIDFIISWHRRLNVL